ncbi:trypsin-1-like [Anoplophora glabripennis]|uniref:trypsin-1-like n=1 Tax=Anoplophora glabripennis TaxID=217634 RepID=UPI000873D53E|nr:trypsin-1-like [Anoplophora glabripennis]
MSALVLLSVLLVGAYAAPKDVPSVRIAGGDEAEPGQFPYQASVQLCIQDVCSHACGGAIISELAVLTAAHCITQAPDIARYEILVGVVDLRDDNPERHAARVDYAIIHSGYTGENAAPHDIAIFKLSDPLIFNDMVQPINLPDPEDEIIERNGFLSGWGSLTGTDVPIMPDTLQFTEVPILEPDGKFKIPFDECRDAFDEILGGRESPLDFEANICTGPLTGGVSICAGDSGTPLADVRGETLIGIATWTANPCGRPGAPSVYNKISFYADWIRSYSFEEEN